MYFLHKVQECCDAILIDEELQLARKKSQLKRKGTTLREEGVWERVGQLERLFSTTVCSLIKVEGKSRVQRSFEELFGVVTDDSHKYAHVCFYLEASCLAPDLSQVLWRKPSVCFCSLLNIVLGVFLDNYCKQNSFKYLDCVPNIAHLFFPTFLLTPFLLISPPLSILPGPG